MSALWNDPWGRNDLVASAIPLYHYSAQSMITKEKAHAIAHVIMKDIRSRKIIGDQFKQIDREIQEDILSSWSALIMKELSAP